MDAISAVSRGQSPDLAVLQKRKKRWNFRKKINKQEGIEDLKKEVEMVSQSIDRNSYSL